MAWAWAPKTSVIAQSATVADATRGALGAEGSARAVFRAALVVAFSGLLTELSLASRSPLFTIAAFVPALCWVRGRSPRHAAMLGWATGAVMTFVGYRFLPSALAESEALAASTAWASLVLFAALRGAWLGIPLAVGAGVAKLGGRQLLACAVLIALVERVLPNPLPFAFGSTLVGWLPLAQVADVLGATGLTLLSALAAAAAAEAVSKSGDPWTKRTGVCALLLALGYGVARDAELERGLVRAPTLHAILVHTDAGPLHPSRALDVPLDGAEPDLIMFPEGALPTSVPAIDADRLLTSLLRDAPAPTLVGLTEDGVAGRRSNTALLVDPQRGVVGRYDKRELLPFAERPVTLFGRSWSFAAGARFDAGGDQPPLTIAGRPLLTSICYEDMLPAATRSELVRTGGQAIVNLTNDGWFRGSHAAELHLIAARVRAIETRRSVLRSTNAGVTAAIDPLGRVLARTSGPATALDVRAPLSTETSLYTRFGDLWLGLLSGGLLLASLRRPRGLTPTATPVRRS